MIHDGLPLPVTLRKAVNRYTFIQETENSPEDGYWIYFHPGLIDLETDMHQIHEYTVKACIAALKRIRYCACQDCTKELERRIKPSCL